MTLINKIGYYFWSSYRRRNLDMLQNKYSHLYHGVVLDIGGRDRGKFIKPKQRVEKWIFADINDKHHPDIKLDVTNMSNIETASIDIVNAIELFEHVEQPERALEECFRVLKKEGLIILSMPFLYSIHGDPNDYQRWTKKKWLLTLKRMNMEVVTIKITGKYFTVLGDMYKYFINSLPKLLRLSKYLVYPLIDIMVLLDKAKFVRKNPLLDNHHAGYFIICRKFK